MSETPSEHQQEDSEDPPLLDDPFLVEHVERGEDQSKIETKEGN